MAEKTRKKVSARTLAYRYERIGQRTERLERLCEIVPGAPDPLEANSREQLISRTEWAAMDTRRRNRAVGFLRRSNLVGRFMLRPPATYLPSPNSDPAQSVERENAGTNDHERLTAALAKLDERSRMILSRRWLAESKATLHELAAEYGVSAERIRQIEANAISKLKKQLAAA